MLLPLRRRPRRDRPREAVVLCGGGGLAAAQVGALRALLQAGVVPDLLVGCSLGALNAASLAVAPSLSRVEELADAWRRLERADVFGGPRRGALGPATALYEPDALRDLVRRWVPVADLADTAVPCHVVTTDLLAGRACWWSAGDPVPLLTASACLPAVLPPVPLGGSLHVDGGVSVPLPVDRALDLGATRTWVLDVGGGTLGRRDERMTALDVLMLSSSISRRAAERPGPAGRPGQLVVALPGLVPEPQEVRDFSRTPMLLRAGYEAAAPVVEQALSGRRAAPAPG